MTFVRRALLALVTALLLVGAGTGRALAHAAFESSIPAQGAVVAIAPAEVLLHFGEAVEIAPGSVRILDGHGQQVQRGTPLHPGGAGRDVAVRLAPELPPGSYFVVWRVVSADSHPVAGTFSFSIGHLGALAVAAPARTDPTVAGLIAAARGIGYLGIAVFLGGIWFVQLCWPAGPKPRAGVRLMVAGWLAAVVGSAGSLVLQGPYGAGSGVGGSWTLLSSVLDSRYGHAVLARLALLVVTAALGWRIVRRRSTVSAVLFTSAAVAMLATFAWTGHAGVGSQVPVAVVSDVTHLTAMSLWLGGLAQLLVVLPQLDDRTAHQVVARFSTVAMVSVGVLVVSGSYQSWRQAGVLDALGSTYYGRLLLIKVGLVLVTLGVAWTSRRWVMRNRERTVVFAHLDTRQQVAPVPAVTADIRALRRSVLLEAVLVVGVLGVTSFLVAAPPAREAAAARPTTVVRELVAGPVQLRLSLASEGAMVGAVEVAASEGGRPVRLAELDLTLNRPGFGAVAVPLTGQGSRFVASDVMLPRTGSWTVTVRARTSPIDEWTATTRISLG